MSATSFLYSKKAGFTLIELLVTVTITTIILLAATTILTTFFLSNSRTAIRKQIKVEGSKALARIEFMARGGSNCTNVSGGVQISNIDGSTTTFREASNNVTIQHNPDPNSPPPPAENLLTAYTISESATVLSCHTEGGKDYIRASLQIQNTDSSEATIDETFTSFTVLRNS